jgi:hypothetical protein
MSLVSRRAAVPVYVEHLAASVMECECGAASSVIGIYRMRLRHWVPRFAMSNGMEAVVLEDFMNLLWFVVCVVVPFDVIQLGISAESTWYETSLAQCDVDIIFRGSSYCLLGCLCHKLRKRLHLDLP